MTKIYKRVWEFLGKVEYDTPHNTCPLCSYVAVVHREHYCQIAHAVITWEEIEDYGD